MTKELTKSYSMNDCQQRRHNHKDAHDPFGCPKTNSSSTSFLMDADHSFQTTGESVLENMMMDQRRRPSINTSNNSKSSNGIGALSNGSLFEGKQSAPTQTTTTTSSDFSQSNANRNIRRMNIMDRLRRLTFPTNSMELMESMDGTSGGVNGGGGGGDVTTTTTNSSPAFTDSTTTISTISDDDGDHQLPLNLITPRATPIPQIPRSSSDFPRHDLRTNPNLPGSDGNGGGGLGISAAGIGLGQSGLFLRNGSSLENGIPLSSINDQVRRIEELNDPTNLNSYVSVGNNNKEYPVEVDIKDCNVLDGYLCGYLTIHNLTAEYKSLTTFFDAEIIGSGGNGFLTRKWSADISIDRCHWNRFDYFRERFGDLYLDGEDWGGGDDISGGGGGGDIVDGYDNNIHRSRLHQQQQQLQMPQRPDLFRDSVIFMRWKERFLVPDYRVDNIPGASYAGFYYMAYDKSSNNLEGYYYHKDANQIAQENGTTVEIQKLDLVHKPRMTSSFYEFM